VVDIESCFDFRMLMNSLGRKYVVKSSSLIYCNNKRLCTSIKKVNEKLLYKGNNSLQIKLMFGVGIVNTIYFSQYLFSCWWYQDVIIEGIKLGDLQH